MPSSAAILPPLLHLQPSRASSLPFSPLNTLQSSSNINCLTKHTPPVTTLLHPQSPRTPLFLHRHSPTQPTSSTNPIAGKHPIAAAYLPCFYRTTFNSRPPSFRRVQHQRLISYLLSSPLDNCRHPTAASPSSNYHLRPNSHLNRLISTPPYLLLTVSNTICSNHRRPLPPPTSRNYHHPTDAPTSFQPPHSPPNSFCLRLQPQICCYSLTSSPFFSKHHQAPHLFSPP